MNTLIFIIALALIIYFIFFSNKENNQVPAKNNFYYNFDIPKDVEIEEKEKIKLWNKKGTNLINFYAPSYHSGQGLLGSTTNKTITNHLNNGGKYDAIVYKKTKYVIGIDVVLNEE